MVAVPLCQVVSSAEEIDARKPAIFEAANEGFKTLLEVTQGKDFDSLFDAFGFDSPGQAINLRLGTPLIVRWIRLDRLKEFDEATVEPDKLLESTFQVLFPILSGEKGDKEDKVVTSLTVSFLPKRKIWKVTGWGDKNVIRGLTDLDQYQKSKSCFVIWIPALHLHFLADQIAGQLTLFPIQDYPRFDIERGRPLPARETFTILHGKIKVSGPRRLQGPRVSAYIPDGRPPAINASSTSGLMWYLHAAMMAKYCDEIRLL